MDAQTLLDRGSLLLEQGRYADAERNIREALAMEPNSDVALSLLSRCYINSGRHREGLEAAQKAVALNPEESFYFYLLGFAHYGLNNFGAARTALDKAISLAPYGAEYHGLKAHVLLAQRAWPEALAAADEGLQWDAESITCLNARVTALNKLSRHGDAIATMQDALAQDPENDATHTNVGYNYLHAGRHREAREHFLEALRIHPDKSSAQEGLKESLKEAVPPYRWMMQYSRWMYNKGENFQRWFPFALFIIFRLVAGVSGDAFIYVAGIWILFVVTSWTINSIANVCLLFHPQGKHALTRSEKISSVSSVGVLLGGLLFIGLSFVPGLDSRLLVAGIVLLSLALPLGRMDFPLNPRGWSWREWWQALLVPAALVALVLTAFGVGEGLALGAYLGLFILFTWFGGR